MYAKVIKWISWALLILGAGVSVYGFIVGWDTNNNAPVETLLWWTYAMVAIALFAAVIVSIVVMAMNNPKSLVKMLGLLVAIAAIVAVAYVLAPGTAALGYTGAPVSDMTLKLTDTMLNLTYFACGAAVIAWIAGAVISAIRK